MRPGAATIANVFVLGWIGFAFVLQTRFPDLYYRSVQEDEYVEWATFWAFAIAAVVFARLALRREMREHGGGDGASVTNGLSMPALRRYFLLGLALFCAVVAMEEISWAQRLLGYRPPEYFLRENFQQEPNIHNVFDTDVRQAVLQAVIGGYGVLLPILATLPWISNLVRRLGVVAPPLALAPAFAGTLALYVVYPWDYSGEIVELMLGLGFLCAALANTAQMDASGGLLSRRSAGAPALACTVAIVLGLTTAAGARIRRSGDDAYVRMARSELAALQHDFLSAAHPERSRYATRCDLHKRVYTYAEKYRARFLEQGDWMGLVDAGLPEQRAKYFLDPWNVPYWIRDNCARRTGTRVIFVYSFGPDRKRESTEQAIAGDDVGVYVLAPPG